jgi:hypothetical protein
MPPADLLYSATLTATAAPTPTVPKEAGGKADGPAGKPYLDASPAYSCVVGAPVDEAFDHMVAVRSLLGKSIELDKIEDPDLDAAVRVMMRYDEVKTQLADVVSQRQSAEALKRSVTDSRDRLVEGCKTIVSEMTSTHLQGWSPPPGLKAMPDALTKPLSDAVDSWRATLDAYIDDLRDHEARLAAWITPVQHMLDRARTAAAATPAATPAAANPAS